DAARIARGLLARGANLDLGLAQINSANLAWLGLSVEAAFDPCRNLSAAGVVLRAGYRPARDGDRQAALRVALSRYNTGHPERGVRNGYVARVERAAVALSLAPPAPASDTAAAEAPVVVLPATPSASSRTPETPAWDVFGRARFSATLAFAPSEPSWRDPR
ncbi:transglycosylase SLT domain-containing protein, partial [Brevundimonas sp.]|uniref:transglycosylase SLT domain-containing protein n=2 Tax=Brevundimonas sp. TaxID=1871086 RepID=UPI0027FC7E28